jgi:hypothetical protein
MRQKQTKQKQEKYEKAQLAGQGGKWAKQTETEQWAAQGGSVLNLKESANAPDTKKGKNSSFIM